MRIAVIFSGFMVAIVLSKWCQFFEPFVDVLNQTRLIVIYIDGCSDVHCRDQGQTFFYAAFPYGSLYLRSNVDVVSMLFGVELQVFSMRFHETSIAASPLTITACVI